MITVTTEEWATIQETLKSAANMTQMVDKLSAVVAEIMNMKEDLAQCISLCNQMSNTDTSPSGNLDMKLCMLEKDLRWLQEQVEAMLSR